MNSQTRWLGLRSYEENDSNLFFGRETEAEQLYRMVRRETLTTIFAPSGTGKSSLLRAGLFPKLRANGYFPMALRLDHSASDSDHCRWLRETLEEMAAEEGFELDTIVPPQANPEEETLWEYLHRIELWDKNNELVTPVFLLDQFEEIFTLGKGQNNSERFLKSLADVIEKRKPTEFRERLNEKGVHSNIPTSVQGFKFILSLREDFVAHLDQLRHSMPSIMHNRMYLKALNGEQALEVVKGPGEGVVDDEVAEKIVRLVAKSHSMNEQDKLSDLVVEPNLLSLVCHELDQKRIREKESQISADGLGHASQNILRDFYAESMKGVDRIARIFVEDNLITTNGFRKSQAIDDARMAGFSEKDQAHLINKHIVRKIGRKDIPHIELTHDLLAVVVRESRDQRHQIEENEALAKSKRDQKRKIQLFSGIILFLLILSSITINEYFRASKAESIAQQRAQESEELVNFMADDLYDRLLPIGRLDLLEEVASKAQDHFSNVESSTTNRALVLNKIGNVLSKKGSITEAMETHDRTIEILLDSETKESINRFDSAKILLDRARIEAEWGEPDKALADLDRAMGFLGDDLDSEIPLRIEAGLIEVEILLNKQNFAEARNLLSSLREAVEATNQEDIEYRKINANLLHAESRIDRSYHNYPAAMESAREALQIFYKFSNEQPGNDQWNYQKTKALIYLGSLHLDIGDLEGAKDKFFAASSSRRFQSSPDPDNVSQWTFLHADLSRSMAEYHLLAAQKGERESRSIHFSSAQDQLTQSFLHFQDSITLETDRNLPLDKSLAIQMAYLESVLLHSRLCELRGNSNVYLSQNDNEKQILRAAEWLEHSLSLLNQSIKLQESVSPRIKLMEAEVYLKLGIHQETYHNHHLVAPELETTVELLKQMTVSEDNARYFRLLAKSYEVMTEGLRNRGKLPEAIQTAESSLAARNNVHEITADHLDSIRSKGLAHMEFASLLVNDSNPSDEQINQALDHYGKAFERFMQLDRNDLFRVEDRLNAARAVYEQGRIAQKDGMIEQSKEWIQMASNLGLSEATSKYMELWDEDSTRLKSLAARQAVSRIFVPCEFQDQVVGDIPMQITRKVQSEIIITNPWSESDENEVMPLQNEIQRLQQDLGLKIDKGIIQELSLHNELIQNNPDSSLSLADYTFSTEQSAQRQNEIRPLITLNSPVTSNYPKKRPSVIGTSTWLTWDYAGAATDTNRRFQLQVSSDFEFKDFDKIVVDTEVEGTRFFLDFNRDNHRKFLNNVLYWRVLKKPKTRQTLENRKAIEQSDWSLTESFGIYESNWERILHTGIIRVGVNQYDGDLLDIDEKGNLGGFDGKIILAIRDKLWEDFQKADRNGLPEITYEQFKVEPTAYGWDGMFDATNRNEVDFMASSVTRTIEREKRYGIKFTEPYFETQLVVIYPNDQEVKEIQSVHELMDYNLVANEGFRGADIGKLIVGDEQLTERSLSDFRVIFGAITKGNGAITDDVFLEKAFKAQPELREQVRKFVLTHKHYEELLLIESAKDNPSINRIEQLREMQKDYGTAEWEQYAFAISARDNGVLLEKLNKAMLDIRSTQIIDGKRTQLIREFCEELNLRPIPERLLGDNQQDYETLLLPSVIATSPAPGNDQSSYNVATIMGDEIVFTWEPLGQEPASGYRLQIANGPTFTSMDLLVDLYTNDMKTTVTKNHLLDNRSPEQFKGNLYWRAKKLRGIDVTEDPYPEGGWSHPVTFEYYQDTMDRIRSTGELRIGYNEAANGVSVFRDEKRNLRGFDLDIVKYISQEISEKINQDIRLVPIPLQFKELLQSAKSNRIDLAISGITRTKQREKDFGIVFTEPYCRTRQAAIWLTDSGINGIEDLSTREILVMEGTRAQMMTEHLFEDNAIPAPYNPKSFLLEKVIAGKADATVLDYPAALKLIADYQKNSNEDRFTVKTIHPEHAQNTTEETKPDDFFVDYYAIPIDNRQTEFINHVNRSIQKLRNVDKELYYQMFEKYDLNTSIEIEEPPFELDY